MNKKSIEVCFSPLLFPLVQLDTNSVVVVADILRATSAICTAFENGAKQIIPVETLEDALRYKRQGYLIAAERDGKKIDFADFGNSPFNFTKEHVSGKTIVYSTTNGTKLLGYAKDYKKIVIGAFLNIEVLIQLLIQEQQNIIILCAGWKDRFDIEDTLFAGALSKNLLESGKFETCCDSTYAAIEIWNAAENNLLEFVEKAAQHQRLKKNNLHDVIPFCFSTGFTKIIPQYNEGRLIPFINKS